jgi:hypothetical protein
VPESRSLHGVHRGVDMESLQALVQVCDQILKQPSSTHETVAQDFFQKHSLEAVFRYVQQDSNSKHTSSSRSFLSD